MANSKHREPCAWFSLWLSTDRLWYKKMVLSCPTWRYHSIVSHSQTLQASYILSIHPSIHLFIYYLTSVYLSNILLISTSKNNSHQPTWSSPLPSSLPSWPLPLSPKLLLATLDEQNTRLLVWLLSSDLLIRKQPPTETLTLDHETTTDNQY